MRLFSGFAVLSILGSACAGKDEDPTLSETCDGQGDSLVLLDRSILFARQEGGICEGFDLDSTVTLDGESTGCGIADYASLDGTTGVDNAFAAMLPTLESTEAAAVESLVQATIASGGLLLTTRLTDLDDPMNDPCVNVEILRAVGTPVLGNDGYILPWQTFSVDDSVEVASVQGVALVDGVIEAHGLTIRLPISIFDVSLDLVLNDASIRLSHGRPDNTGFLEDGWDVLMAGGVESSSIQEVADSPNVDDALSGLVAALLAANVDLAPENGVCTQLSMTFQVEAIPAFL